MEESKVEDSKVEDSKVEDSKVEESKVEEVLYLKCCRCRVKLKAGDHFTLKRNDKYKKTCNKCLNTRRKYNEKKKKENKENSDYNVIPTV